MTRRQIAWLMAAVGVAHAVFFWLISGTHPLPKSAVIPPPNFVVKEGRGVDPQTGGGFTYREIRVPTQLAMPDPLFDKDKEPEPAARPVSEPQPPAVKP